MDKPLDLRAVEARRLAERCDVWATHYEYRAREVGHRNWPEGENAEDAARDFRAIAEILRQGEQVHAHCRALRAALEEAKHTLEWGAATGISGSERHSEILKRAAAVLAQAIDK